MTLLWLFLFHYFALGHFMIGLGFMVLHDLYWTRKNTPRLLFAHLIWPVLILFMHEDDGDFIELVFERGRK